MIDKIVGYGIGILIIGISLALTMHKDSDLKRVRLWLMRRIRRKNKWVIHYMTSYPDGAKGTAIINGTFVVHQQPTVKQMPLLRRIICDECKIPVQPSQLVICNIMEVPSE